VQTTRLCMARRRSRPTRMCSPWRPTWPSAAMAALASRIEASRDRPRDRSTPSWRPPGAPLRGPTLLLVGVDISASSAAARSTRPFSSQDRLQRLRRARRPAGPACVRVLAGRGPCRVACRLRACLRAYALPSVRQAAAHIEPQRAQARVPAAADHRGGRARRCRPPRRPCATSRVMSMSARARASCRRRDWLAQQDQRAGAEARAPGLHDLGGRQRPARGRPSRARAPPPRSGRCVRSRNMTKKRSVSP
jgi:hypothetical protein